MAFPFAFALSFGGCINGPLRHFRRVDEGLYSGSVPSRKELRQLVATYGIRTIIKLNPNWQGRDRPPPDVQLIDIPIPAVWTPRRDKIMAILDALDHAPRPIFIHCRTGADRTGLIIGLYRLRHGATVEAARADMAANHFISYHGLERVWELALDEIKATRRE